MTRTVAEKLQIKPATRILLDGADAGRRALLDPLPEGVREVAAGEAEVAVAFVEDRAGLEPWLASALPALRGARAVWIAYRKGGRADINRDSIWALADAVGWAPNANIAISEEWSALRIKPLV